MTDIASLVLAIDSTQVGKGVGELDRLTAAGGRAEASTTRVTAAAVKAAGGWYAWESAALKAAAATKQQAAGAEQFSAMLRTQTVSASQMRAGMQQLSFQLGDVAQQFALGVSPMRIFAQQAGQVTQAIGLMTGSSRGLIGFIGGPWGQVIIGAAVLLGSLWAAHGKAADGANTQADAARELKKAIDDLYSSTVKEGQSAYASAEASIMAARTYQARATEARKAAVAELELAKAGAIKARAAVGPGAISPMGLGPLNSNMAAEAGRLDAQVKELEGRITSLNNQIGKSAGTIRLEQGKLIGMRLTEQFDATAAAAGKFQRTQDELNKKLAAGTISLDQYAVALRAAKVVQETEEKAARASSAAHGAHRAALSDSTRAYDAAAKSAADYLQRLKDETDRLNLSTLATKQLEITQAAAKAPTEALSQAIREQGIVLLSAMEAGDQLKGFLQTIRPSDMPDLQDVLKKLPIADVQLNPLQQWMDSIPKTAEEVTNALQTIQVRGFDNLGRAIADVVTGTATLKQAFSNLARSVIGDIIQMTVKMLIFRAISGIFSGGLGKSAFPVVGGVDPLAPLPGMASGGVIGGFGGTDNNILSINGVPRAKVSADERLAVIPNRAPANNNSVGMIEVHIMTDASPEFDQMVDAKVTQGIGIAVKVSDARADARFKGVQRPRMNGGR